MNTGATVIITVGSPFDDWCSEDWRKHWTTERRCNDSDSSCGDYTLKMAQWINHVKQWVDWVKTQRVIGTDTVSVQYDIWNEPDLQLFWNPAPCPGYGEPPDLSYNIWHSTADSIRAWDPLAVITGPSLATLDGAGPPDYEANTGVTMEGFLDACIQNQCLPDVLGWHDLGYFDNADPDLVDPEDPERNLYAQIVRARQFLSSRGIPPDSLMYELNEMLPDSLWRPGPPVRPLVTPGILVREFALAERVKADGLGLVLAARSY